MAFPQLAGPRCSSGSASGSSRPPTYTDPTAVDASTSEHQGLGGSLTVIVSKIGLPACLAKRSNAGYELVVASSHRPATLRRR